MDTIEVFFHCEIPQQFPGERNITGKNVGMLLDVCVLDTEKKLR